MTDILTTLLFRIIIQTASPLEVCSIHSYVCSIQSFDRPVCYILRRVKAKQRARLSLNTCLHMYYVLKAFRKAFDMLYMCIRTYVVIACLILERASQQRGTLFRRSLCNTPYCITYNTIKTSIEANKSLNVTIFHRSRCLNNGSNRV